MSSLEQSERKLLDLIAEFAGLVKVPEESAFEDVWTLTNQICDRYALGAAKLKFPPRAEMAIAA